MRGSSGYSRPLVQLSGPAHHDNSQPSGRYTPTTHNRVYSEARYEDEHKQLLALRGNKTRQQINRMDTVRKNKVNVRLSMLAPMSDIDKGAIGL